MKDQSGYTSEKWKLYLMRLREKGIVNRSPQQIKCHHHINIIPRSGYLFGISLWRCMYCELVVQSM
jgi:hypothetical protein